DRRHYRRLRLYPLAARAVAYASQAPRLSSRAQRSEAVRCRPGIHMWTAPGLQEVNSVGSKRLRSYVRSVDAVAHDRCQDGARDASSKQVGDAGAPLDPAECLASWDRSITPSVLLEQASASARGDDRSRAELVMPPGWRELCRLWSGTERASG